ncbi:protein SPT2 homolog [Actinia tenebrosa]|uniref:Protein SPT2 homolog n=1 Tax=Actinia tenebrosa TaxID=6105 RepID=A0A6P8J6K7_ACTTE|nr:protein SPT2 homolog [Actinia tenebrosa]XP_031575400.1 protein SPT2 homolog [Actinia tenebrosa]
MNFQELMSKASENNISASKQLTKSGHKHKDSAPGVCNSAVKAFLERKEQEQKKKQADEEAAKRARIQARLLQNLKTNEGKKGKNESTPKSSFLNPPYKQGEEEEKSMLAKWKKDDVAAQYQKSGVSSKPSVSGIKSIDITRSAITKNMKAKHSKRISKDKSGKSNDFVVNGKKSETSKVKKEVKTASAPPNFKELLAIAEKNKFGLKRTKRETETVTGENKTEVTKLKRWHNSSGEHELTEMDEKQLPIKNKEKVKEKAVSKAKGKQKESLRKTAVEPDRDSCHKQRSHVNESSKTLKRIRDSETLEKNALNKKPSKPLIHHARPQESKDRMMYEQKNYYPRPTHNYYEEEEDSDLDGFIVDGEDEACAEQTDVSKYIKDIFGYDRRRYAVEDFDDSAMESNYGQIEREEKRSAKIAKLEDEIEILKEQAELKRLRDNLKKSKKTRKK